MQEVLPTKKRKRFVIVFIVVILVIAQCITLYFLLSPEESNDFSMLQIGMSQDFVLNTYGKPDDTNFDGTFHRYASARYKRYTCDVGLSSENGILKTISYNFSDYVGNGKEATGLFNALTSDVPNGFLLDSSNDSKISYMVIGTGSILTMISENNSTSVRLTCY